MGTIAAIGDEAAIIGFTLGGALIYPARTPIEVQDAWRGLPEQVELVILTKAAADSLPNASEWDRSVAEPSRSARLVAVIPQ